MRFERALRDKWYPATPLGEYEDIRSALGSVGLSGPAADAIEAGMNRTPFVPTPYRCQVNQIGDAAENVLVVVPMEAGRIALYIGFFALLSDTWEDATLAAAGALIEDALAGAFAEPPIINAFQWRPPVGVFQ